MLRALHEAGAPWESGIRVAVLHSWGSLRTWNCSGHMHEHPELPLNHLNEALAGLPVRLRALSFDEVATHGVPDDVDVLINAGTRGDAWSGGGVWLDGRLRAAVSAFVARGGGFIGVGEPSAAEGGFHFFQTADILGVDREVGQTICFNKFRHHLKEEHFITRDVPGQPEFHNAVNGAYALDGDTQVLKEKEGSVTVAAKEYGKGRGAYFAGFTYSPDNARLLYRALAWVARREDALEAFLPDNTACECAFFPQTGALVVINNSEVLVKATIPTPTGAVCLELDGLALKIVRMDGRERG